MLDRDPATVSDTEDKALWTGLDPAKNLATQRAQTMTDADRYQAGFDDGFKHRGVRGSLSDYPSYQEGRLAGAAARF